jgi:hypothetical protein
MSRTDSRSAHSPGAPAEERASPLHLSGANDPAIPAEPNEAFWAGVQHGLAELQGRAAHPHLPAELACDLTRGSAEPSLISSRLTDAFDAAPPPAPGARAARHDGWTPEKERIFCQTLAASGVVADACRAAGMSRDAAYARRRATSGRAFALAWDAARLVARAPVADAVMSRAMNGVVERVYKDGALVAERHRYDNRLTMAVLARLDRIAEGADANGGAVRAAAEEFEQMLDLLPGGNAAAEAFLAPRLARDPLEPPHFRDGVYARDDEPNMLARAAFRERHGVGLPSDVPIDDLDNAEMTQWTDEQICRAEASGYLASLEDDEDWPDLALDDDADGSCAGAECPRHGAAAAEGAVARGMCKLRKLYLRVGPGRYGELDDFAAYDEDHEADEADDEEEDAEAAE